MSARALGHARPARDRTAWLLAALVLFAHGGVLRLGYFADDFTFVDAAQRRPPGELLLGWWGIWPWYRPLTRELYFALAAACGSAGPVVAHAVGLLTLWLAAVALAQVLARRIGVAAAAIGVALFVVHALTAFLTGWLSGFQDVLALALVAGALVAHQRRHVLVAALCAALAPFAKETGFLALMLLPLDAVLGERRAPTRREWAYWSGAAAVALALHALVRMTWPARVHPAAEPAELQHALPVLAQALTPWTTPPGPATAWAWAAAASAAVVVALLVLGTARRAGATPPAGATALAPPAGARGGIAFVAAALGLALLPALAPALLTRYPVRAHFYFGALPWGCAVAGWAIARLRLPARAALVALACGACVWSAAPRHVDLDAPAGWRVGPLGWAEAQRIEARTRRLESDVRVLLASRPESLAVGYVSFPAGAWFQTGDGPATRVVLGDRTVRAWGVRELPAAVLDDPRVPLALLDYDGAEQHGFVRSDPADPALLRLAIETLLDGRAALASRLARCVAHADTSAALPRYVAAAAALADGAAPHEFARAVAQVAKRAEAGGALVADVRTAAALRGALAAPLSPAAHRAAADSLAAAHAPVLEALELLVAVRLDRTRARDALQLGGLIAMHMPDGARAAFTLAARPGAPPEVAAAAREAIARLGPPR